MPKDTFDDFLLVRDDALADDLCDELIRRFAMHPAPVFCQARCHLWLEAIITYRWC